MTLDELYVAQSKDDNYKDEFFAEALEYGKALLARWYGANWKSYEDALQDLFMSLLDPNKAKPNGKASFRTWFRAALQFSCEKFMMKENREHSISKMPEDAQVLYRKKNYYEVLDTIDLRQRMNVLSPQQKDIINLTLAGFNQKEIAERLGLYEMAVSRLYNSAVRKLRAEGNNGR